MSLSVLGMDIQGQHSAPDPPGEHGPLLLLLHPRGPVHLQQEEYPLYLDGGHGVCVDRSQGTGTRREARTGQYEGEGYQPDPGEAAICGDFVLFGM